MTIKRIFLVFFIALIIRACYALFFVDVSTLATEDQALYINLGENMARTGEFLRTVGDGYREEWVTSRVPGYPKFLALVYKLFGENNMAVIWFQIIIDSITCVVIGLIAESIVTRAFLYAGLVSALNLNMIILSGMVLTDTLFLFLFSLFILSVFYYLKSPTKIQLFLAVFFLSIASLVRSVSYFIIILLLMFLIFDFVRNKVRLKKAIHTIIIYLIPVTIVLGPIHYRNYEKYNTFQLTSQGGKHTLGWVVPAVYQYSGQGDYEEGQLLAKNRFKESMYNDNFQMSANNPFENDSYKMQVAKEILTELGLVNILHSWTVGSAINLISPSVAFAPIVRKIEHPSFYAVPGSGVTEKLLNYISNMNGMLYLFIILSGVVASLFFVIVSIIGFYNFIKSNIYREKYTTIVIFSIFLFFYFFAITGPIVGVKYRLPVEPIMTLYFTYALINFGSRQLKHV